MSTGANIRIRMYRVGFGDCFLLSLQRDSGTDHILIDCGTHPRGSIGTMDAVVKDIVKETGGKLALVIATHAHADHLSGFATHLDTFRQFEVREVWLPWIEDPHDKQALRIKQQNTALVQALQRFAAKAPSPAAADALALLTGNDAALNLLKSGINGGTVTYLAAGKHIDDVAGIKGLSVSVLGPPRNEQVLVQMNPPAGEHFLRVADDGTLKPIDESPPFDESWVVQADSNPYYLTIDTHEQNLLAVAAMNAEMAAFALDQIINNTSIVALFSFGGKNLLFAGDAQYGSWKSWIEQETGPAQLAGVNFYKVAHHGSLNATPRSALTAMPEKKFVAMASTQNRPWASIPLPDLMAALTSRASAVVRSDSIRVEGAPRGPALVQLPDGFQQGAFWFDYCLAI
jgi:beta-lactamase superfamily II metal-dependent hydrolase